MVIFVFNLIIFSNFYNFGATNLIMRIVNIIIIHLIIVY